MTDQQRASAKVTLEDLLRVKRAERPPPDFWVEFERSLRAKQLAALVEKRPWWKSWTGFSRWSIPVGAAAALTVTVVTFTSRSKPSAAPLARASNLPAAAKVVVQQPPVVRAIPAPSEAVTVTAPAVELAQAEKAPADAVKTSTVAPAEPEVRAIPVSAPAGRLASVTEQVAGIAVEGDFDGIPAARFANATVKTPTVMPGFTFTRPVLAQSEDSARAIRPAAVEPLAQMSTPRDARRARLLAFTSSVDTRTPQYSNSTGVIRSRERIASHLSEEALYDSIRRLGVKDGGVSIQF